MTKLFVPSYLDLIVFYLPNIKMLIFYKIYKDFSRYLFIPSTKLNLPVFQLSGLLSSLVFWLCKFYIVCIQLGRPLESFFFSFKQLKS